MKTNIIFIQSRIWVFLTLAAFFPMLAHSTTTYNGGTTTLNTTNNETGLQGWIIKGGAIVTMQDPAVLTKTEETGHDRGIDIGSVTPGTLIMTGGSLTINETDDLAQGTGISINLASTGTISGGSITVNDSGSGNGLLFSVGATFTGDLNISGGTFVLDEDDGNYAALFFVGNGASGNINISGGTFNMTSDDGNAWFANLSGSLQMDISGGDFSYDGGSANFIGLKAKNDSSICLHGSKYEIDINGGTDYVEVTTTTNITDLVGTLRVTLLDGNVFETSYDQNTAGQIKFCTEPGSATNGTYTTTITADPGITSWDRLLVDQTLPSGTSLEYTITDTNGVVLFGPTTTSDGVLDISSIDPSYSNLILKVELSSDTQNITPVLNKWTATYETDNLPSINFQVEVDNPLPEGQSQIDNNVEITTDTPETDPDNNEDDDEINVLLTDPCVTKSVDLEVAATNQTLTYTISYTNNGPNPATNVVITDILPDGVTFGTQTSSLSHVQNGQTNTWTTNSLAVGAGGTITLTVTVKAGTEKTWILNTVRITNDRQDTDPDCNEDSANTFIDDMPNLVINKSGPASINFGAENTGTYTIVIQNVGNTNALDVSLTDPLPAGLVLVGASPAMNMWDPLTNNLATNASITVEVYFVVTDTNSFDETFTNTACTAATNTETSVADNCDDAETYVTVEPARLSGAVRVDADGVSSNDADRGVEGIAGVTITLTGTDIFGNSVTQSTVTATDGSYSFAGLNPGSYTVVEIQPTGYGDVSQFQGTNSVCPTCERGTLSSNKIAGVELQAGDSSENNDFSEYVLASIGDRVWFDVVDNGVQDAGEVGYAGVTVMLFKVENGVTNEAGVQVTDGDGNYLFENLATGDYFVAFALPSDAESFAKTNETTDTVDSDAEIDCPTCIPGCPTCEVKRSVKTTLTPGEHDPTWDAGIIAKPLAAIVLRIKAMNNTSNQVVEFETGSEMQTAGFFVQRQTEDGGWVSINAGMVPALGSRGGIYQVSDAGALPGETNTYRLEEVMLNGRRLLYGPYELSADLDAVPDAASLDALRRAPFTREEHTLSSNEMARLEARATELAAELEARGWLFGDRVFLKLKEAGMYQLSLADIANWLEIPSWYAEQLVLEGELILRGPGGRVTYVPDTGGLLFYGESYRDLYTDHNTYVLSWGRGGSLSTIDGATAATGVGGSFRHVLHYEEDKLTLEGIVSLELEDFWMWDQLPKKGPGKWDIFRDLTLSIGTPEPAADGADAQLTLRVKGGEVYGDVQNEHGVRLYWNDVLQANYTLDDFEVTNLTLTLPAAQLNNGDNNLKIENYFANGALNTKIFIDYCRISYDRTYIATGNQLEFESTTDGPLTLDGFDNADIQILDISDPTDPVKVINLSIEENSGTWKASFNAQNGHRYAALAAGTALSVPDIEPRLMTDLLHPETQADYLIISKPTLLGQAQRLADHRASQGLNPILIDVTDIYAHFSDGRITPDALTAFLTYATHYWETPPRYVLFCGDGSIDYLNSQGYNDMLIPSTLHYTPFGLFSSDGKICDLDHDDLPDIAYGRLPVLTIAELSSLIDKIIAYENADGSTWARNLTLLADEVDGKLHFHNEIDNLHMNIAYIDADSPLKATPATRQSTRTAVLNALQTGTGLFDYLGHGTKFSLGYSQTYLNATDARALTNSVRQPLVLTMTCLAGRFTLPGEESLAEALLLNSNGGAIAIIAPTGMTITHYVTTFNRHFLQARYHDGINTLGDCLLETMRRYKNDPTVAGDPPELLKIYNLLGDPALRHK